MDGSFIPSTIAGEKAAALIELPRSWQNPTLPESYVNMARLFLARMREFGMEPLANDALEFYGRDFAADAYPDFAALQGDGDAATIIAITQDLFAEFGYAMPASFYWLHLDMAVRDDMTKKLYLRSEPAYADRARGFDAALHGQKVFAVQMKIQSIASQYGLTFLHGCKCGSCVAVQKDAFGYDIPAADRTETLRAFVWTMMYEYAIYPVTPVAEYLSAA